MQNVYKDGTLGEIKDFNLEDMIKQIEHEQVDHVRVFEKYNGGNVGLSDIENKHLEGEIKEIFDREFTEKFDELQRKREIMIEYRKLTGV